MESKLPKTNKNSIKTIRNDLFSKFVDALDLGELFVNISVLISSNTSSFIQLLTSLLPELSLGNHFWTTERIQKEEGFYPLKDNKSIFFHYSRYKIHYGLWWLEESFSKHADNFFEKSEAFDLPKFQELSSSYLEKRHRLEPSTSSRNFFLKLWILLNTNNNCETTFFFFLQNSPSRSKFLKTHFSIT